MFSHLYHLGHHRHPHLHHLPRRCQFWTFWTNASSHLKTRSRGGGVSCEDSICILESQSTVSSNDGESFSAPFINSEAAFVKAIAYDNIW
ncbi:hypothetical protein PRUPE_3G115900 [Prunus persica]|uniref:Uncharacterized protein n=1 Tax=Prunus persica TaxID=3760 RepID=A0A251PYP9_PRUPE|nr:hypothetical protein PRUPE_3G115900 [Prunus persica]